MRTIKIKAYKFNELNEDAKQKAVEKFSDINVEFDSWQSTYEDAERIGLKITGFDLDRNRHASGELINSLSEVCEAILKEHGEECETFKTAKDFLNQWSILVKTYSNGIEIDKVTEENEYTFDGEADELENEFRRSILEDYSIMLQKECEYLQSKEAIIEAIEANEYEFTEEGKQIY